MSGVQPQLQVHVRISLNVGLTLQQLGSVADALAQRGHSDAAARLRTASGAVAPGSG